MAISTSSRPVLGSPLSSGAVTGSNPGAGPRGLGPSAQSASASASFSQEIKNAAQHALSVISASQNVTRGSTAPTPSPQSAFVSRPYLSGTTRGKTLNSAITTSMPVNSAPNTPSEDAPRMNAQGQVTGLLLNERA